MRYETKWYKRLLDSLFPPGVFTFREGVTEADDSWLSKWHRAQGAELNRFDGRLNDLADGYWPDSAVELLVDWERNLDITATGTVQDRQAAVVAKLRYTGGVCEDYFKALALTLGYVVTFETFTPAYTGWESINQPLYNDAWVSVWWISVPTAGLSIIRTAFEAIKPADVTTYYIAT